MVDTSRLFYTVCSDSWSLRLSSMGYFFSDIWFLINHPHTCPSSWLLPEKTPGCQEKHWYCVLRETGQTPIFVYWFRCIWNSLLSSDNPLLEKVVQADLLIANRSDTWTYQVLHALQISLHPSIFNAIRSREAINIKQFELTLRERIIGSWRELDNLTPHDNHHSSRIMRTYHTHFGEPLGIAPGWWGWQKKKSQACVTYLPSLGYFQRSQPCTFLPSSFW